MRSGSGPPGNSTVCSGNRAMTLPSKLGRLAFQRLEQLAVQTTESSIAHDEHLVAGPRGAGEALDQLVERACQPALVAQRGQPATRLPAEIRWRKHPYRVGGRK